MHMQYTSLDACGGSGGGGIYTLPNAAAVAAAASAFGNSAAECVPSPFAAAAASYPLFNTSTDAIKGVESDAEEVKNVMQQSQLANFMQSFHHFQNSTNFPNAFGVNISHASSTLNHSSSSSSPSSVGPMKKKSRPVPEESKNSSYFERRKKNNDSARRSRELRRQKEEENERRRIFLEQENQKLTIQLQHLYGLLSQHQLCYHNNIQLDSASRSVHHQQAQQNIYTNFR